MEFFRFQQYIDAMRELNRKEKALHVIGIDVGVLTDCYQDIASPLLHSLFTISQRDTLEWWLYDVPNGIEGNPNEVHMWKADDTPIPLLNEKQLYDFIFETQSHEKEGE